MKSLVKYGFFIAMVYLLITRVLPLLKPASWDLMVCKTLMSDGVQCYDTSYVLKGYKSQAECMEKGIELARKEGFECGKNCKVNDWGNVCDVICNKAGCS